jgi:predicted N-acetyltransferase YhbS
VGFVEKAFVCRASREGDEEAIKRIVESTFSSFMEGEFWDWKYRENPSFDRSLVAVAEADGKLIGCNHWLRRRFRVSGSVEVESVLGADIAVSPEYRRTGVGRALLQFLRASDAAKKGRFAVIYMFANPGLSKHFHSPIGGYVPSPDRTVAFTRVLNWNRVKENAANFNKAVAAGKFGGKLEGEISILFKVASAPPLFLRIGGDGVQVHEKEDALRQRADVVIVSDVATLSRIKDKEVGMRKMLGVLLTGRLKIRGGLAKMWGAYEKLWVLREVLGGKIT